MNVPSFFRLPLPRLRHAAPAAVLACLAPSGAAAQSVPGIDNIDWSRQNVVFTPDALRAFNDVTNRWTAAWRQGDARRVADLYSVGAAVAFRGAEMVRGRDAVFRLLSARMPSGVDIRLSATDFVSSGDVMSATGPFVVEGGGDFITGTYSMTLRLEQGRWRIRSQVFTPDIPLARDTAAAGEDEEPRSDEWSPGGGTSGHAAAAPGEGH